MSGEGAVELSWVSGGTAARTHRVTLADQRAWTMRRWCDFRQWIILLISQDTDVIAPCTLQTGGDSIGFGRILCFPRTRARISSGQRTNCYYFLEVPETIALYLVKLLLSPHPRNCRVQWDFSSGKNSSPKLVKEFFAYNYCQYFARGTLLRRITANEQDISFYKHNCRYVLAQFTNFTFPSRA